ncbi:ABC transporter substrate-binding protein [Verrucomicrobia bacterium LW23]|nr:ABC transporter substrate-binding protein [Verrucomicrobia bacterium LW23]
MNVKPVKHPEFTTIAGAALLAMVCVLTLAGLTACGPSSAGADGGGERRTVAPSIHDYVSAGTGKPGGTLRVSIAADVSTLDLQSALALSGSWFGRILYDNLVYLDDKGNITPWLAKSWTISADGKTYTFRLREDVTFSDGTRFDAQAVLDNFTRIRDPATKSPLATAYIEPYIGGRVIDEFTFEATLREPYSPFLYVLAQSPLGFISPKAIRERPKTLGEAPVTTGPYVVEQFARQQKIIFVRRTDYNWAPDFIQHKGPAYIERIEVDIIPEAISRYGSLVSGQFDITLDAPPQNAAGLRSDPAITLTSRILQGNPMRAPVINTQRAPFDDLRIRKAYAYAIDREAITQMVGFGEYTPKTDFLASNTPYYDPSFKDVLHYDLAKANALLDEAGWTGRDAAGYRTKDGKRLTAEILLTQSGAPNLVVVEVQSSLKKIGFELTISQMPNEQRLVHRDAGTYQVMGNYAWHTNTPDALYIVYHTNQIISDKLIGANLSRLSDPELDELLSAARRSTDPAVLKDLYSKAQRRLVEIVPSVPLFENHNIIAYRKRLKGVIYDTSHNRPVFTSAWLDEEGSL